MIKIMVDSSSDCMVDAYDYFVPLTVNIDGKEYRSGIDLDSETFYKLLTSLLHADPTPFLFPSFHLV